MALGEFDDNMENYREIDWLVFFLACIFNIIVLLNLLISILSDTFARFSAIKNSTAFKEKVYMMTLMQDSIFGKFVKS